MRNLIILLLAICMSCSSTRQNKTIPYLLHRDTENSIYNELLRLEKNKIPVFYLEHLSGSEFKIHLIDGSDESISTDRKVFINDKFYPLIFDTDFYFYAKLEDGYPQITLINEKTLKETEIKIPSVNERIEHPNLYGIPRKSLIIDNSLYWIVDTKGKLIGTNSKK